jgi:hypothetical protein
MSERSNLNNSLPGVLSMVKAFDRDQFCTTRDAGDSPNVDTFGRNCCGSPIQMRCSTASGSDELYSYSGVTLLYLREQERQEYGLQELGQPPRP